MCTVKILLVLCFSVVNALSRTVTDCPELEIQMEAFEEHLIIYMHKAIQCNFYIFGYRNADFFATIEKIDLQPPQPCTNNYLEIAAEDTTKFCANNGTGMTVKSASRAIEVTILVQTNATVVLKLRTIQDRLCGAYEVQLNSTTEIISYMYHDAALCFHKVLGIPHHEFYMTIPNIELHGPPCTTAFISADILPDNLTDATYKKCGNTPVTEAIQSASSSLFLLISAIPNGSVSLQFETLYPECGEPEIKITEFPTLLTLPAKGYSFSNHTQCIIKVSSTTETRVKLTTKDIKFPSDCENNYAKVARTMQELKNTTYIKCGSSAGKNYILSNNNGVLYIFIKLTKIDVQNPYVTFEFNSGVDKPRQYVLVTLLIYMLLSAITC